MDSTDIISTGQIRDCARDAQDAVEAARGHSHCSRGVGEELAARLVGRRDLVE
jgi:hypothetical protein